MRYIRLWRRNPNKSHKSAAALILGVLDMTASLLYTCANLERPCRYCATATELCHGSVVAICARDDNAFVEWQVTIAQSCNCASCSRTCNKYALRLRSSKESRQQCMVVKRLPHDYACANWRITTVHL